MTTKKGSLDDLDDLHGALTRALIDRIRSGVATAADLNVARQLLKDNGIDAAPKGEHPLHDLAADLPFADPESIARSAEEYH